MKILLIFLWIWAAMIALSFVEAYVEGKYLWHRRKIGWKIGSTKERKTKYKKIISNFLQFKPAEVNVFTGYHFYLFIVMLPLLLTLPLIIYGFDLRLLGILISAYLTGLVLEDFVYFLVNPAIKFSDWNPEFVNFTSWIKIGSLKVPIHYITGLLLAFASWYFIWR